MRGGGVDKVRMSDDAGNVTGQHRQLGRTAFGALGLLALLAQTVAVPRAAAASAAAYPQVAHLERPYVIGVVVAILGFESALLSAWMLLSTAKTGEESTSRVRRWANLLAASLWFMAAVIAGVCVHAAFVARVGGPPTMLGLLLCLAVVPGAVALRRRARGFSPHPDAEHAPVGHA
jgi:cytochrome bd-type quinol oxidase subunit 2